MFHPFRYEISVAGKKKGRALSSAVVQQGGEDDERYSITAFDCSFRGRFVYYQGFID